MKTPIVIKLKIKGNLLGVREIHYAVYAKKQIACTC